MALDGLAMEAEEVGVVALLTTLLVPGLTWALKGKTTDAKLRRGLVLAGTAVAAVLLEQVLDRTANTAIEKVGA